MAYSRSYLSRLKEYAFKYIEECVNNKKEHVTNTGKIVHVLDRKNPTVNYFLVYWLPKHDNKGGHIGHSAYYRWMNWKDSKRQTAIKEIDDMFSAIQYDIVANEGKGLHYIKHKFGWTDKVESKNINIEQPLFNNVPTNDSNNKGS